MSCCRIIAKPGPQDIDIIYCICFCCLLLDTSPPSKVIRRVTLLDPTSTMKQIPSGVPCNYTIVLSYNVSEVMGQRPSGVAMRLGILGHAGTQSWQIHYNYQDKNQSSLYSSRGVEVYTNTSAAITIII